MNLNQNKGKWRKIEKQSKTNVNSNLSIDSDISTSPVDDTPPNRIYSKEDITQSIWLAWDDPFLPSGKKKSDK
jgi:hypothetical protein